MQNTYELVFTEDNVYILEGQCGKKFSFRKGRVY